MPLFDCPALYSNFPRKSLIKLIFGANRLSNAEYLFLGIWLLSFMDYDLGYFDEETRRLEPLEYPFAPEIV